jgi:hypothetical protein
MSPSPGVGRGGDHRPEVEVESEPGGRARQRPSFGGRGRVRDRLPESRLSPSPGVGRGGDRLPSRG